MPHHAGYSLTSRLVCQSGQFELLCSTTGMSMRWTIDFPQSSGVPGSQFIPANTSEVHSVVISDSTILFISITSLSPLTYLLEINNTLVALNGTRIDCISLEGTESTVLTVIGHGKTIQYNANDEQ